MPSAGTAIIMTVRISFGKSYLWLMGVSRGMGKKIALIIAESIDTAYRGAVGCRKQAFLQGCCRKSVPTL